ncbi:surface glycoprotein [Halorubrum depositum]|uniref:surface glycoprotein n=1 Tax=Halorubrum depositum TaxID=2583992 RepID=UPI0011A504D6|nr:surface glycoprotein [Halorubrum depositum]
MTDGNNRKKAQAVFFSLVMVLSMVGGSVALAGSAAASPDGSMLSDTIAQPGDEVTISGDYSGDYNGESLYVTVDKNQDGSTVNASFQIPGPNIDENGSFEYEADVDGELGLEDGDESDIYVAEDQSTLLNSAGTLTVDGTAPEFGNVTPESDVNEANAEEITLEVSDETTSVDNLIVTVTNGNEEVTWEINPDSDETDGVSFADETLTITPGSGDVPALSADNTYNVDVTAEDTAGNSDNTNFNVDVTSAEPSFTLDTVPETPDDPTNNENVTVTATVDGGDYAIDNSTVSLTVLDEDGNTVASYDESDSSVYENVSLTEKKLTLDPDANNENVSSYADGSYSFEVTATNNISNANTTTYEDVFTVDTTSPEITDVSVTNTPILEDTASSQVVITFAEEDVDVTTIDATVNTGDGTEALSGGADFDVDENVAIADLSLGNGAYTNVENDSAIVNVTAADDEAGNALANPNDSDSNQTFAIDTLGPTVSVNQGNLDTAVSGLINVTGEVSVEDADGNEPHYVVVTDDGEHVIDDPRDLDTTELPEGQHVLSVSVEDDSGNYDSAEQDFTVDNVDPTIEYVGSDPISGDVDVEDAFDIHDAGTADVSYSWSVDTDASEDGFVNGDGTSFNVNDVGEGDYKLVATVTEHDGSTTETADVRGSTLDIETATLTSDGSNVTATVESDLPLDSLDVRIPTTDEHFDQSNTSFSLDDFEPTENENELTVETSRDGEYTLVVDSATSGDQVYEGGASDSTIVDSEAPSLVDADVIGVDSGQSQVELKFSEPLATTFDGGDVSFENDRAVDIGGNIDSATGTAVITFDREIQTGDDPELVIDADSYTDANGTSNQEDVEVVDSAELDLTEGANFVSVPVETGAVPLDEVDTSNVDAIWAYDDGEWESFDPDADENDFDALEAGQGYVLYADSDTTVDVRGYTVIASNTDDGPTAPAVENLQAGWNFVGHFQEGTQSADRALTTVDQVSEVGVLGQASQYSVQTVDALEPGESYWVFVESNDQYVRTTYENADQSAAPSVTNVNVTDGDDEIVTTGDTVTVSADVVDDNLQGVFVDASPLGGTDNVELTPDGGDTYSASFDVGSEGPVASDGEVNLTVVAFDDGGVSSFGEDGVTVPEQVDTVSIDDVNAEDEVVNVTVEDTNGVASAELIFNGSDDTEQVVASLNNGLTEGENTVDVSGLAADNYDIELNVSDSVGNEATDTDSISLTTSGDIAVTGGDVNTNPVLAEDSIDNHEFTFTAENVSQDGDTDEFWLTFPDEVTVDVNGVNPAGTDVTVSQGPEVRSVDSGDNNAIYFQLDADGGDTYTTDVTVDAGTNVYPEGDHDVNVSVVDSDGDTVDNSTIVTVNSDGTAPQYVSASDNGTVDGNTTLNVTLNDSVSGLNASTIDSGDFNVTNQSGAGDTNVLSSINTDGVTDGETGDQIVVLTLDGDYSSDDLQVAIEGEIEDGVGNALTSGTQSITRS